MQETLGKQLIQMIAVGVSCLPLLLSLEAALPDVALPMLADKNCLWIKISRSSSNKMTAAFRKCGVTEDFTRILQGDIFPFLFIDGWIPNQGNLLPPQTINLSYFLIIFILNCQNPAEQDGEHRMEKACPVRHQAYFGFSWCVGLDVVAGWQSIPCGNKQSFSSFMAVILLNH